jgi:plasmid stability protein
MRTTLDIPDGLYRKLKARAAYQGTSVKELVLRGIHTEMQSGERTSSRGEVKLPIIRSKKPGHLKLTNAKIDEILFS